MKNEKLFDHIGKISEDYIFEAMPGSVKRKKPAWIKWGAAAACLALTVFVGTRLIPYGTTIPTPGSDQLPMLTISAEQGVMGFEGYFAYDIREIVNENPWSENTEMAALPVYENTRVYDENHQVIGADLNKMKERLTDIASKLGMDTDNLEITDDSYDEATKAKLAEKMNGEVPEGFFSVSRVFMEDSGIKVEVDANLRATISFEPPVSLPKGYNFTHHASYDDVAAIAEYLKEKYSSLINMQNPKANISGGDYNTSGQQSYRISFFDASGSIAEQIIHYHFNNVTFASDDDGKLFIARVYQEDLSNKIADYPIITAEKAKELLVEGNYITTVPVKMPGKEYVAKVELVYRTGNTQKIFMPYYRFLVEIPDMAKENGMKTYGAYYVPAVEQQYISNMPVWKGNFN